MKAWNAQNAGAAAVLVADDKVELLITMDTPDEGKYSDLTQNITIPSALIDKHFGDDLKRVIAANEMVNINLDWRESLPHPDERVEYEFWTNSNDICGPKCDAQAEFKSNFKGVAQLLEKGGYTSFIPHYITWYCPQVTYLSTMYLNVPSLSDEQGTADAATDQMFKRTCYQYQYIASEYFATLDRLTCRMNWTLYRPSSIKTTLVTT